MSRWRPAAPQSSAYVTAEGQARLKAEFEHLWRERRPEVVRALAAAAAEGDRSENAEYIYRKKELREIDRRLQYLTTRLENLKVVDTAPSDLHRVYFGAWVTVQEPDGQSKTWRLVGADEIDAPRGWISIDAPLARGLLGRRVGETVEVKLPAGSRELVILAVQYGRPANLG
ncbi:transcription elongation factor GreB [Polycyclovorans algicola]|uniref:transcription elongation factor GreB n=1 Tax=Polycyclovorans algicola TaxID=616992 RepID=UPI0004A7057F|nr:transcription elongation factor GreB [Polycyclovorans algicola]